MAAIISAVLLSLLCAPTRALYFYLEPSEPRCFLEELPPDTTVVGKYKNPDYVAFGSPGFNGMGVKYEVRDPNDEVIKTAGCDNEGRFAFTSPVGGEYRICFLGNSTLQGNWFGGRGPAKMRMPMRRFRIDLRIDVGEMAIDYAEAAKLEHLTELEVELRRLNNKLKDMMREQAYQKEREVAFRLTSESTHARVAWWSVLQASVMVLSGIWQIRHLTAFFKSKKIV